MADYLGRERTSFITNIERAYFLHGYVRGNNIYIYIYTDAFPLNSVELWFLFIFCLRKACKYICIRYSYLSYPQSITLLQSNF